MPTGYTCKVQDGTITDFREFALNCAKAFGACITLRDEPSGTPIPEKFEAHTSYHDESIQDAIVAMDEISGLSDEDCEKRAFEAFQSDVADYEKRAAEREEKRLRYKRMLAQVNGWEPPSSDHAELKSFMRKQLTESIDFDCGGKDHYTYPDRETGKEWRDREFAAAERNVNYHTEQRDKELERTQTRNKWVADLRGSFGASSG